MFGAIFLSLLTVLHIHSPVVSKTNQSTIILSPIITSAPTETPTPTTTPSPTPIPSYTPVPTNTPIPLPVSSYESLFDQFSNQYTVDKNLLKKIALCESGINPSSNGGIYAGMYQFAERTWINTRSQMGADTNPDLRFSAKDAIETAAFKISHGGIGAWSGCL